MNSKFGPKFSCQDNFANISRHIYKKAGTKNYYPFPDSMRNCNGCDRSKPEDHYTGVKCVN